MNFFALALVRFPRRFLALLRAVSHTTASLTRLERLEVVLAVTTLVHDVVKVVQAKAEVARLAHLWPCI